MANLNEKYGRIINEGYTVVNNSIIFNSSISTGAKNLYQIIQALCIRSDQIEHSQKTLAGLLGKSVRTVQRYLDELKRANLIETIYRFGYTNIYKPLARIIRKDKEKNAGNDCSKNNWKDIYAKKMMAWKYENQRTYDPDTLEKALTKSAFKSLDEDKKISPVNVEEILEQIKKKLNS